MSKKEQQEISTTQEVFETLNEQANASEQFFEKNSKIFTYAFGAILVAAVGYFSYQQFVVKPKNIEASEKVFQADKYFATDSLNLALNGDGSNYGYKEIISEYKGSDEANISRIKAANVLFNTSKFQEAIDLLEGFSSSDHFLPALVNGMIGDCYVELKNNESAFKYYDKGIAAADNALTSPILLKKAGILAIASKDNAKATGYFQKIKDNYATSRIASDIEKYLNIVK